MNYNLNKTDGLGEKVSTIRSLQSLISHMVEEKRILLLALFATLLTAGMTLLGPMIIGYTVDQYVVKGNYQGILTFGGLLLITYVITFIAGYIQARLMGNVGQGMLFNLRNRVFQKIQELPLDFFNQNKTGDLISRINNDTDKINQFFSQSLMQLSRFTLIMIGAAIFLLSLNLPLGAAALSPAIAIWVITRLLVPWVKNRNAESLRSTGSLSSEVQESLSNFKVVVAFNRRDYFRTMFDAANMENYRASMGAGTANNLFMPLYTFFSSTGHLVVLTLGIYLISKGSFSIGLLVSFLSYVTNFYNPLRQLAALWTNFQVALAAWDRIRNILQMQNNMPGIQRGERIPDSSLLTFRDVSFSYPDGKEVLHHINFRLERGTTYAFVGPTGGGKTTTASLIARLYDPTEGQVLLDGYDIRSYSPEERVKRIGFILQEPFLFSGTIRDNILYGNEEYENISSQELTSILHETGLERLLERFEDGLETPVDLSGEGISLGQKQLIAFIRTTLRRPDLLILDEATANIDTITEKLLEEILRKLPPSTTKVIIAHRLNTIAGAQEIFFVSSGEVIRAGSLDHALTLLMEQKMVS